MKPDPKVEVRKQQLADLRKGELPNAVRKAREIHGRGHAPATVRIRRPFIRLEEFGGLVEDERKPLPKEQRPPSAQMISPRGLTLKLYLLMLFAAQCEMPAGKQWQEPYPIEPSSDSTDSWQGLVATIAKYAGPGVQAASVRTNKVRQIAEAMKTLEKMGLLTSATGVAGQVRKGVLLLCENGKSKNAGAANIPYTVPHDGEEFVEIPIGFFTNGWVHVLTTSEIAALLMWFDVMKFHSLTIRQQDGSPYTYGFVLSHVRHGRYGLGRDAYETHQPLEAFDLLTVHRPEKRHLDGKWKDFEETSDDMVCHRVHLKVEGFEKDADEVVQPVLKRRHTIGQWDSFFG
ncbi:hypothetical protein R6L23_00970 [Streptomyces sp. SR27]|uniref:hypothetical protein n=1 Tax=Streptomyces sp. SR27 TaxID=3076630 RepID=UPI00295B1124|nr:hypothetical protein [Streptomyces sp. SR27]MDV9186820.1 hypothetical protein [Streptomyces sp. SR27]